MYRTDYTWEPLLSDLAGMLAALAISNASMHKHAPTLQFAGMDGACAYSLKAEQVSEKERVMLIRDAHGLHLGQTEVCS